MHQKIHDQGVIKLEKKTVLQYLSRFFWVFLFKLLGRAKLLQRHHHAAVPVEMQGLNEQVGLLFLINHLRLFAVLEHNSVQSPAFGTLAALDKGHAKDTEANKVSCIFSTGENFIFKTHGHRRLQATAAHLLQHYMQRV
jgi:hypothetical protein